MKIILTENVDNLGVKGEVKDVAPGYFFNYLLTNNLARKATKEKIKKAKEKQAEIKKKKKKLKKQAKEIAEKLKEVESIKIEKTASEQGVLYAQLSPQEIASEIKKQVDLGDFELKAEMVIIEKEIKKSGSYQIAINLPQDVKGKIEVEVVKAEEEEEEE